MFNSDNEYIVGPIFYSNQYYIVNDIGSVGFAQQSR